MSEVIRGPWEPIPPEPERPRRQTPDDHRPAHVFSLSQVEQALRADSGNFTYRRLYEEITGRAYRPVDDTGRPIGRPFE